MHVRHSLSAVYGVSYRSEVGQKIDDLKRIDFIYSTDIDNLYYTKQLSPKPTNLTAGQPGT
jgi:hypothetical protein